MPLITIIIFQQDKGSTIKRTIQSIRRQTFSDYETVIADNIDMAVQRASGEWVIVLSDRETLVGDNALATLANNIEPATEILFGNAVRRRTLLHDKHIGPSCDDFSVFAMMENPIPLCSAMVSRTLLADACLSGSCPHQEAWLEFQLQKYFIDNCRLKYVPATIAKTDGQPSLFDLPTDVRERILTNVMPRFIGDDNPHMLRPSRVTKAVTLYQKLKNNKLAAAIYNTFIKPHKKNVE